MFLVFSLVIGVLVGLGAEPEVAAATGPTPNGPAAATPVATAPGETAEMVQPRLEPISDALAARLARATPDEKIPVIIRLSDSLDLARVATTNAPRPSRVAPPPPSDGEPLPPPPSEIERRRKVATVATALVDHADAARTNLDQLLRWREKQGTATEVEPLWIINGLATTATPAVIEELAQRADVATIDLDATIEATMAAPAEPNIANVTAPDAWTAGFTGQGVVVGVIDSGADLFAGELADTWRGGTNSWIDYVDGSTTPIDPPDAFGVPHGTVTTGVIVGDDRSGTSIGMAPGAQWIGARVFNQQGQASLSDLHSAFQWMLDPDGNPATADAPAVVNASWALGGVACDLEFEADVQALVAAGILPVFAAGNQGTTTGASSPANYVDALGVGAVDNSDVLWDDGVFGGSNQGPTDCGTPGNSRVFPDLVAPGVDIKTVEGANYYFQRTGTSVAAPHVSGAAALLLSEFPGLTPAQLRAVLVAGATDLGPAGPDNSYGQGRLDVAAARAAILASSIGDLVWADENGNGAFDTGEPGINGVTVELIGPGPDTTLGTGDDVVLATTTTSSFGVYSFDGLIPGTYRVQVDETSLPPYHTLTAGLNPADVTLALSEVRSDVDFGYQPPAPGSVTGRLWDDLNGDGVAQPSEPPVVGASIDLVGPGPDRALGTGDDVIAGTAVTDATGTYGFPTVAPDDYRVLVDLTTLPSGTTSTTGGEHQDIAVVPGQHVTGVDFGWSILAPDGVFISLQRGGTVNGGALRYANEDIMAWDGTAFSTFFDGSDLGLAQVDVDAFQVLGPTTILLSLNVATTLPGVGDVDDSDILLFTGTTGPNTTGTLEMYFDGSDVGLTTNGEDVDGFDLRDDGTMLFSTRSTVLVPGLTQKLDEDVLAFAPSSLGVDTAGVWTVWFDGSDVELTTAGEDVDAIDSGGPDLLLSTMGDLAVTGLTAADHDIVACNDWGIGETTTCTWTEYLRGDPMGIGAADIDGLSILPDVPTPPFPAPLALSVDSDGTLNGGALAVDELDVVLWDGTDFSMLFDASDVGITTGDLDGVHLVDGSTIMLSFDSDQTLGGVLVDDADIVTFTGQLGPDTSGTFSVAFDGSDVGLINAGGDVDAFHLQDDGTLIVSIYYNRSVPGLGQVQDRDLLLFTPVTMGTDTAGTWTMYLDGSASELNTYQEDINGVMIVGSEIHLTTIREGDVAPVGPFERRDLLTCSGLVAATDPCSWQLLLAGTDIGLANFAIDAISR